MTADAVIPAVLYAAKSTPDEKESNISQLDECRRRAIFELGRLLVSEHREDNKSGWKGDRGDELEAALTAAEAAAEEHGVAELWVWKSERLARGSGRKNEARSLLEVYTRCKRAGVTLRSVIDDEYVQDEAMVGMASKMAEKYSADLSANVRQATRREAKNGRYLGPPPLGYRREGERRESHLVVDPDEAAIVRRIFGEFVKGRSMTQIAKDLNADKVPTKKGVHWRQAQISGMVRNPIFIGKVRFEEEVYEGIHDAIVEEDTFDQARRLLDKRPSRPGRPPTAKRHLFLNGFLRCAACGDPMVPCIRAAANYEYYECSGRVHGCKTGAVRRRDIDEDVLAYFEQSFYDADETRRQLAVRTAQRASELAALLAGAEGQARESEARLSKVKRDYTHGDLTVAEWRDLRAELEPEATAATAEVDQLRQQLAEARSDAAVSDADAEVIAQLARIRAEVAGEVDAAPDLDAVRAVLTRLFDCFLFHPELPARANIEMVGNRYWIEPVVSQEVIEGYAEDDDPAPGLPQAHGQAEKNYNQGSGWLYLQMRSASAALGAGRTSKRSAVRWSHSRSRVASSSSQMTIVAICSRWGSMAR
jgi:site-specific DNA recombinase